MKRTKNFSMGEMRNLRNIVCEKTGYYVKNRCLLVQAFTRSSYSAQYGGKITKFWNLLEIGFWIIMW